ncbi:MAG: DGQHR domain-containing protein [Parasphingorhabdus sp.]
MAEDLFKSEISVASVAAVLVTQGRHRFYTMTLQADMLAKTCFVVVRDEDPIDGFQRLLSETRARNIADYIDNGLGTIPTSVILSAQPDADFHYDSKNKTARFKLSPKSFLILDGQHRIYGFSLATSNLRVPVVIYAGLTRAEESKIFIDINTEQKPVPNELLLDIKKLADSQNEVEALLSDIFDKFDSDPMSPLFGKMSPSRRKSGLISRVTFNNGLKPLLKLFADGSADEIYHMLAAFFGGFIHENNNRKAELDITSPTVFKGMCLSLPEVVQRVRDKFGKEYTVENFSDIFSEMFNNVRIGSLKEPGISPTKFSNVISSALKPTSIF